MASICLDERKVEAAVLGGAVLGGGGGGWIEDGMQIGRLALEVGQPHLITIDELKDEDLIVTVSLVGAPAEKNIYVKPVHYLRALELLSQKLGREINGIITNENGASTTVNGWFQSAITGIPVVDAPCNGRAHPTGSMGAMNLSELTDYVSIQAAVGGKGSNYIEFSAKGSLDKVSSLVRRASVEAGGMVAVARNPVKASYVKQNGALGAIQQAIRVGEVFLQTEGDRAIEAVASVLSGNIVKVGTVLEYQLETTGGFDVGRLRIDSYEITFWNEYMTLEINGERLATFPDLIMTLDVETGRPVVSAAVEKGKKLAILTVPKENLLLGSTMRNPKLLQPIEKVVGKSIVKHLF